MFEVGPNTRLAHAVFGWAPTRVVGNDYVLAGLVLLAVLSRRAPSPWHPRTRRAARTGGLVPQ